MTAQPLEAEHDGYDDSRPAEHGTWMELAACHGKDPGWWWPTRRNFPERRAGRAVCRECPVQGECLSYALAYDERFGIWGGKDEHKRREMRRDVNRRLAELEAFHHAWADARRGQW